MSDFYALQWQDSGTASSSPCRPLMIMPWARPQRGVAVRHRPASSSLNPNVRRENATLVWDRCLRATLVYSGWVGRRCKEGRWGEREGGRGGLFSFFSWCILVLLYEWVGSIGVIVYGSHAQTQSLFLLLHNNNTAQACHTACTSQASALDYRGPTTTLHRSREAMPAVSGFSINSDGIY